MNDFGNFGRHFSRATSAKHPRSTYARVPQAMAQLVPYHRANPNTKNGARLLSLSPIMALGNKPNSHTPKVEIHTRQKLWYFGLGAMLRKRSYFVLKVSSRLPGLECSCGKTFIPVTEISVAKTEISVTGPARLLIWAKRNFYEGKCGEA